MADMSDKLAVKKEENANLKLQLDSSQEVVAALELQFRQKVEVLNQIQEETLRKDQAFEQEINQLKEKLENRKKAKELREMVKHLKEREVKNLSELKALKNNEQYHKKVLEEYDEIYAIRFSEMQQLKEEYETVKSHVANLELAFSDVHQKYERNKKTIFDYVHKEEAFKEALMSAEHAVDNYEEKYETLKVHATTQLEKANQEMKLMCDQYDSKIHKSSAIIKGLELKNASLADSIDQRTKECNSLAALYDEITGKV